MTGFGAPIGVVLTVLVGSVALVGGMLAPPIGPLAIVLGVGVGALADIESRQLRLRIEAFRSQVEAAAHG